jgi:hypothetical protein
MYTMTTRFVILITAALACTVFVVACGSGTAPPSKACVDAARLYAESLDVDRTAPEGEKADKIAIKKESLAALEERKIKACGE